MRFPFQKFVLATLLLLTLCVQRSHGQQIITPSDPAAYSEYFTKLIEKTKNTFLINKWNSVDSLLTSSYDTKTRDAFIALSKTMAARNHNLTEFQQLYILANTIAASERGQNIDLAQLYQYLDKCVYNYPAKSVIDVFQKLNSFFENNIIYDSKFNKLYVFPESFSFKYAEKKWNAFDQNNPEPTPPVIEKEEDFGWDDILNEEDKEIDLWDSPSIDASNASYGKFNNIPLLKDLLIEVKNTTLVVVSPSDSLIVENTSGFIDLFAEKFVGEGGKTTWENVFIPTAVAELSKYSFKLSSPQIKAEEVTLTYQDYLVNSIKGVLEIKGENRSKNDSIAIYPRFKSYKSDAEFAKLDVDIEYKGGFSLIGNRIFSTALYENISTLTVNRGKPNNFEVIGRNFEFTDSLITSKQASFKTYIGTDSIVHPAIVFRYEPLTKLLKLYKVKKGGFRNAMYSDTFHQMDIKCDALDWDVNNGQMNFYIIAGKSEIPAVFESFNYYNPERLRTLSTVAGWNPLIFLGTYVYRKKVNEFTLEEIYKKVPKDPSQIKNGVIVAMQMGFIDYDPFKNTYNISRKGLHYYQSANGAKDYDDLVLASISPSGNQNASLDRNSNSLDIAGTQEFKLSDSLGIRFLPKDKAMKLEGSNSYKFAGEIIIKNYRIVGDFDVDYDNFKVNLKRIDTIAFTPVEIWKKGGRAEIGANIMFAKTGTLFLNAPNNKSGRKNLPEYPKLEIPEGATVYFNNDNRTHKYNERVVFKIPKISQDSLNAVDMAYFGQFYSGGIIKPIQETLTTMADTSIGFIHKPKGNYELYNTTSTFSFSEPLQMTKRGLLAKGTLNHLASSLIIDEAYLLDSSFNSVGKKASIKEMQMSSNTYFPAVAIDAFKGAWKPYSDSLKISSQEVLSFYSGTSKLTGSLVVRSTGLFGQGSLERSDSKTVSEGFKFNKDGFLATASAFTIKSANVDAKPIIEGTLVDVDFSILQSLVNISPKNSDFNDSLSSSIQFPNAAYRTNIDNAKWDIKKKIVRMEGDVENSRFFATNKDQYGLAFNGASALYDIEQNALNIQGVPGVNSVDAMIVPSDGKVVVKAGKLEPFSNAKVVADTLNKFHVITNANITINSKLSYQGGGFYQYVNVSSDTFNIKMSDFIFSEIDKNGEMMNSKKSEKLSTIAKAKITVEDSVFLSPKIIYRGEMTMLAPFKNLNLNGSVRPELAKYPFLGGNWINYSGSKSESIQINIDNTLKDGGKPLFAGLHLQGTSSADALYPTFLSAKRYEYDHNIFLAKGLFSRDEENKRFVIEDPDQKNPTSTERYELYDDQGLIRMEGNLSLLQSDNEKNIQTVGIATVLLDSLQYGFNTMMKYNFPIAPPLLQKIGTNIVKSNLDIGLSESAIAFETPEFKSKMTQFLGIKAAENYLDQYQKGHIPLFKFNPKFFASILFSDLSLKWNPTTMAFHNYGKLGISNIGETDINAMMNGYFEIVKAKNGDEVNLFIEVSENEWYYFGFKNGQMGIVSSDFELNQSLVAKENGKASKDYEVIPIDLNEAMDFRKKFLLTYLGAKEEDFKKSSISSTPGTLKKVVTPDDNKPKVPGAKPATAEEEDGF